MREENVKRIKKEDKSAIGKYLVMIFVCTLAGAAGGFFMGVFKSTLAAGMMEAVNGTMKRIIPYGIFIVTAVISLAIFILYQKSRKQYRKWDNSEEEIIDRIEVWLGYGLWLSSLNLILNFFIFAAAIAMGQLERCVNARGITETLVLLAGFLGSMTVITLEQQKLVNFEKEINPEKQGSIFDFKFKKKWEESCDEAEKFQIYKCSYKAYSTATNVCLTLWLFCVLGSMVWDFGVLPVTMVSIIWGTLLTSYSIESIRSDKKAK